MAKQLQLEIQRDRDDLEECRAKIVEMRQACKERGWKLASRYRKGPRKFYFTVTVPNVRPADHVTIESKDVAVVLRQWFPEANLTSGGYGWGGGDAEFTFAERRDRDALDRPTYEWKDWM